MNDTQLQTEPRTEQASPETSEPPPSQRSPGFYRCAMTDFYVTLNGRVYLLRNPSEHACLHQCHALPTAAVPSSAPVEPTLEILARTAEQLARPWTARMRSIHHEVRRDRRVAVATLLQGIFETVSHEIERLLLDEHKADPVGLHERLTEQLDVLNRQRIALESHGINRRGDVNQPAPPHVPLPAVPFVHRGQFIGWSVSLAAATSLPGMPESAAKLRDAHMRSELWTVSVDGLVYVFRCSPTNMSKETA